MFPRRDSAPTGARPAGAVAPYGPHQYRQDSHLERVLEASPSSFTCPVLADPCGNGDEDQADELPNDR